MKKGESDYSTDAADGVLKGVVSEGEEGESVNYLPLRPRKGGKC